MAKVFMTDNQIVVGTAHTSINHFAVSEVDVAFLQFTGRNIVLSDDPVIGRREPIWVAPLYEADYHTIYSCSKIAAVELLKSALTNAFYQLGISIPDRECVIETFAEHVLSK